MKCMTSIFCCIGILLYSGLETATARDKEPYCNWEKGVTEARLDQSDAWLYRAGDPRIRASMAEHLPVGLPEGVGDASSGERLLAQPHFLIWYDTQLRAPLWTAHHLTQFEAQVKPSKDNADSDEDDGEKRADSFRSDPRLEPDERSRCRDYNEPIFDQGHMVPNADLDFMTPGMPYALGMDHSFLMSNMTPQHCAFNRGPWQVLEGLVRNWATKADDTWIITGAIYQRDDAPGQDIHHTAWRMQGKDGDRRIAIPSALYKIVAQWEDGQWHTLTVMLPNTDRLIEEGQKRSYITDGIRSLSRIQQLTGLPIFRRRISA